MVLWLFIDFEDCQYFGKVGSKISSDGCRRRIAAHADFSLLYRPILAGLAELTPVRLKRKNFGGTKF